MMIRLRRSDDHDQTLVKTNQNDKRVTYQDTVGQVSTIIEYNVLSNVTTRGMRHDNVTLRRRVSV